MNVLVKFKAYLQLRDATTKADNAHHNFKQKKERYYVIAGQNGKLIVLNRKNFRLFKQKHYIDNKATVNDLLGECFYFTPDGGGNYLSEEDRKLKEKNYYAWVEAVRKSKKQNKK